MSDDLAIERDGDVQVFTLSRPNSGNALSPTLVEDLHEALDKFEAEAGRVIVLRGAGRNFCTGFDLSDLAELSDADLLQRFVRIELLLARLWTAPYATIAAAQGRVMGAGADLFTACARRIALDDTTFTFPGAAFGLVLGTRRLAQRVGSSMAEYWVASGDKIDARAGVASGLATSAITAPGLPAALDREIAAAVRLDAVTLAAVRQASARDREGLDSDLAALVRSAARPGIGARIAAYRAQSRPRSALVDP